MQYKKSETEIRNFADEKEVGNFRFLADRGVGLWRRFGRLGLLMERWVFARFVQVNKERARRER
ncbi:hypothetical protein D3C72_2419020 [compost metagenome]